MYQIVGKYTVYHTLSVYPDSAIRFVPMFFLFGFGNWTDESRFFSCFSFFWGLKVGEDLGLWKNPPVVVFSRNSWLKRAFEKSYTNGKFAPPNKNTWVT